MSSVARIGRRDCDKYVKICRPRESNKPDYSVVLDSVSDIPSPYRENGIYFVRDGDYISVYAVLTGGTLTKQTTFTNLYTVENIAELKTIEGIDSAYVIVRGYSVPGDGGGGDFYWDDLSVETDNIGTIIQSTGIGTGRWKRVISNDYYNVLWFGADRNGAVNSKNAIQKCIDEVFYSNAYGSFKGTCYIPSGYYLVSSTIIVPRGVKIKGDGIESTSLNAFSWSSGASAFMITTDTNPDFKIENLLIGCTGACSGIYISNSYGCVLEKVRFDRFNIAGLNMFESGSSSINFCDFTGIVTSSDTGLVVDGGSNYNFYNCIFGQTNGKSVTAGSVSTGANFESCNFAGENNTSITILKNGHQRWLFDKCYFEGFNDSSKITPFVHNNSGSGAKNDLTVTNCNIAGFGTNNITISGGARVDWSNNSPIGPDVTFGSAIGNLIHVNNNYVGSFSITNQVYFSCQNILFGSSNAGEVKFGNQDVIIGGGTLRGPLTVNTAAGWTGFTGVVFGDDNNPANATGVYLRGNGADCFLYSAGAALLLGTLSGEKFLRALRTGIEIGDSVLKTNIDADFVLKNTSGDVKIYHSNISPESVISAPIGSICFTNLNKFYIKNSGASSTGWVEFSASKKGSSVASGNGSLTTFTIAHSLGATPSFANVQAGSIDSAGISFITLDATNITVNYSVAPISGTNNLTFYYEASI